MKSHLQDDIIGSTGVDSENGTPHAVIDPSTEQPVSEVMLGSRSKRSANGREGGKCARADFIELKTIVGEPA